MSKLDEGVIGPWLKEELIVTEVAECRGDRVRHVQDLFRLLRRRREYLIEADRQLRN
jgi:hypothetical protein